ncbi:GntR family transcriptional regulator [bacterium]|nr:GntR family transcriptional regulator [bacterium]
MNLKLKLDKPLQVRIQEAIMDIIQSSGLKPGDQIPTESVLIKELGTGRSTLRESLANMTYQGILYKVQGKGTFVRHIPVVVENGIEQLFSVTEQIMAVGLKPSVGRCVIKDFPADKDLAEKLNLREGEPCLWIERIRKADDTLAAYCIDIIPKKIVPGAKKKDFDGSLFVLLEDYGHTISHTESNIQPTILTPRDLPELKHISMFMLFEEIFYDTAGNAICHSNDYYSAEIFKFNLLRKRNL